MTVDDDYEKEFGPNSPGYVHPDDREYLGDELFSHPVVDGDVRGDAVIGASGDDDDGEDTEPDEDSNLTINFADGSYIPTNAMADNARRALAIREKKPMSQRGMTSVGIARARDLMNKRPMSEDTVRRMKAFFDRHEADKQGEMWDEQGKGWQAWNGWGGDEGYSWATAIVERLNKQGDKKSFAVTPEQVQHHFALKTPKRKVMKEITVRTKVLEKMDGGTNKKGNAARQLTGDKLREAAGHLGHAAKVAAGAVGKGLKAVGEGAANKFDKTADKVVAKVAGGVSKVGAAAKSADKSVGRGALAVGKEAVKSGAEILKNNVKTAATEGANLLEDTVRKGPANALAAAKKGVKVGVGFKLARGIAKRIGFAIEQVLAGAWAKLHSVQMSAGTRDAVLARFAA